MNNTGRSRWMWLAAASVLTLAGIPGVPGVPGIAAAQEGPFIGVVTKQKATLHSRVGRIYVTGHARKGQLVQVDRVVLGWYKIRPPKGTFSYISKAFVDVKGSGDEKTAAVNINRAVVKAPNLEDKGNSFYAQVHLNKGTKVNILGEYGNYYMVGPPKGAYVYILMKDVVPATKEQIRKAREAEAKAARDKGKPAGEKTKRPVEEKVEQQPTEKTPKTPVTPEPAEKVVGEPKLPKTPATPENAMVNGDEPKQQEQVSVGTEPVETQQDPALGETEMVKPEPTPDVGTADIENGNTTPDTTDTTDAGDGDVPAERNIKDVTESVKQRLENLTDDQPPDVADTAGEDTGEVDAADDAQPTFGRVEQRFVKASAIPVDDQPLAELLRDYELLQQSEQLTGPQRMAVDQRLAVLRRRQVLAGAIERIIEARERSEALVTKWKEPVPPPTKDAVGWLLTSSVYDGVRAPHYYRLVDPATRRTLLYVKPGGPGKPASSLGRMVRITGPTAWNGQVNHQVMQIDKLEAVQRPRR